MFRPNLTCQVSSVEGTNLYGKETYTAWVDKKFSIVKLEQASQKTSVRTDSSATRGSAQEILTDARFLFPKDVELVAGDRIKFGGFTLVVVSVFPRHHVNGQLDHWQVDADIWAG